MSRYAKTARRHRERIFEPPDFMWGKQLRWTDAIHDDHIMVQDNYLFTGNRARDSVTWARAVTGDSIDGLFDAILRSMQQGRSVPL